VTDLAGQALAVFLVFTLLAAAVWKLGGASLAGRLGWSRPRMTSRKLETLDRMPLTPQHAVHLVRFGGRELIVATHPHGCSVLLETRAGGENP